MFQLLSEKNKTKTKLPALLKVAGGSWITSSLYLHKVEVTASGKKGFWSQSKQKLYHKYVGTYHFFVSVDPCSTLK